MRKDRAFRERLGIIVILLSVRTSIDSIVSNGHHAHTHGEPQHRIERNLICIALGDARPHAASNVVLTEEMLRECE